MQRKRHPAQHSEHTRWWHVWGPALIAALVGAIPGAIALLNQNPDTSVTIIQPQGYIVASGKGSVQFSMRIVNDSQHEVVLEDGGCTGKGETAGMEAVDRRLRHSTNVPEDLFDYPSSGAINGIRLGRSEGVRVACRFMMPRGRQLIPSGYDTNPGAATSMSFTVNTSDGRTWSWHGPVNVYNPTD